MFRFDPTTLPIQTRSIDLLGDQLINVYPNKLMHIETTKRRYVAYNHQLNGYLYCVNNPLIYVDPTGETMERDIVMILGGYIGGTIGGLAFSKIGGGYLGIVTGAFGTIGGAYLGYQAAGWLWDHYNP